MSSSIPGAPHNLRPIFPAASSPRNPKHDEDAEHESTRSIIASLNLQRHIEGGYFAEIDRNPLTIPNPFLHQRQQQHDGDGEGEGEEGGDWEGEGGKTAEKPVSGDEAIRNASTSIYYLLTPLEPQGCFHRNRGRTIHTLISGRGQYVLIHADEAGAKKRIETFVVGTNLAAGEKAVWVVEGGKYKASFLLDGCAGAGTGAERDEKARLLISETVIPGFEYCDHDFLTLDKFRAIVSEDQAEELEWLVRKS